MNKEILLIILIIVFGILAVVGFIYDFVITQGQANVIVAVAPMMITFFLISLYRREKGR